MKNENDKDFQLEMFRKVLGSIQDHISVIDRSMRIVMSNWKNCDSVPARDKQGHPYCYSCLMKRSTPCEPCYMLEVLTTGRYRKYEIEDPLDGRTKSVELSPVFDEEHNVSMVVRHTRDISERKHVESVLKMRESQHAAVAKLGQQGLSGEDLDSLMKEAVRLVAKTLDVEYCRIMKQEKDGSDIMVADVGWQEAKENVRSPARHDNSSNILCYTLYSGEPAAVMEREVKERFSGYSLLEGHGLVSGMDVLIGCKDSPFGTLSVHTGQSRVFTEDDIHFMQSVANVLAESVVRRENEEDLQRYTRELESSTELKVLFTDILTHDLLNPANIVRGFTEELLIQEDDKDKIRLLEKVHTNNEKLIEMMESAAKFIKLESISDIRFEEQDVVPIIERAVRAVRDDVDKKGIKLVFNPVNKYIVRVSPLMEEVFINLLSNAVKYSPEKERIVISIQDLGDEYRIQIADFGPGISSRDKPMIFERFKRVDKGSVKGSGLGLAIVKRIVDLHKGRAGVDDNPLGKGSVFWIALEKV